MFVPPRIGLRSVGDLLTETAVEPPVTDVDTPDDPDDIELFTEFIISKSKAGDFSWLLAADFNDVTKIDFPKFADIYIMMLEADAAHVPICYDNHFVAHVTNLDFIDVCIVILIKAMNQVPLSQEITAKYTELLTFEAPETGDLIAEICMTCNAEFPAAAFAGALESISIKACNDTLANLCSFAVKIDSQEIGEAVLRTSQQQWHTMKLKTKIAYSRCERMLMVKTRDLRQPGIQRAIEIGDVEPGESCVFLRAIIPMLTLEQLDWLWDEIEDISAFEDLIEEVEAEITLKSI